MPPQVFFPSPVTLAGPGTVAKLTKTAGGFRWADTFDPATRAAGNGFADYIPELGSWSVSTSGYAVETNAAAGSFTRYNVSPDINMVLEVDGYVDGPQSAAMLLIAPRVCTNPQPLASETSYSFRDTNQNGTLLQKIDLFQSGVGTTIASRTPASSIALSAWNTLKISRIGSALRLARGAEILTATDSTLLSVPFGIRLYGAGTSLVRFRNLVVYSALSITVAGLSGTQYAALTDPANTVLAKALQSGGTSTIDVTSTTFAPFGVLGKVRVYSNDPATSGVMQAETGVVYHWGGDAWSYAVQPVWSPAWVPP